MIEHCLARIIYASNYNEHSVTKKRPYELLSCKDEKILSEFKKE